MSAQPFESLLERVEARAKQTPQARILTTWTQNATYAGLLEESASLSQYLSARIVTGPLKIAVWLPNGTEYVVSLLAALRGGGLFIPLDITQGPRFSKAALRLTRPSVIVASKCGAFDAIQAESEQAENAPILRVWADRELAPPADGWVSWRDAVSQSAPGTLARVEPDAPAAVFFTSGTSGEPQAVVHSQRGLTAPAVGLQRQAEQTMERASDHELATLAAVFADPVRLSVLPFHTIAGHAILVQSLVSGQRLVTLPLFHPRRVLEIAERERATMLIAVPYLLGLIERAARNRRYDLSQLRVIATGAAGISSSLSRRLRNLFGCSLIQGYGSTELGGGVITSSLLDRPVDSERTVGLPYPGVDIRIIGEAGEDVAPGEMGELAVRVNVGGALGVLDAAGAIRPIAAHDGWYQTGDLAVRDERGYVSIVGRRSETLVRGGKKFPIARVEEELEQLPTVLEAAALSVGDHDRSSVFAFIAVAENATFDPHWARRQLAQTLPRSAIPRRFIRLERLPRTATGKVRKGVLAQRILRRELPNGDRG